MLRRATVLHALQNAASFTAPRSIQANLVLLAKDRPVLCDIWMLADHGHLLTPCICHSAFQSQCHETP